MSRPFAPLLLVALVAAACAAAPTQPDAPQAVPVEEAPRAEPIASPDPCAEFNAREAEAARRHREPGECPHCPCACVGGEIRCAPCVRCDPGRQRPPEWPEPPMPPPRE